MSAKVDTPKNSKKSSPSLARFIVVALIISIVVIGFCEIVLKPVLFPWSVVDMSVVDMNEPYTWLQNASNFKETPEKWYRLSDPPVDKCSVKIKEEKPGTEASFSVGQTTLNEETPLEPKEEVLQEKDGGIWALAPLKQGEIACLTTKGVTIFQLPGDHSCVYIASAIHFEGQPDNGHSVSYVDVQGQGTITFCPYVFYSDNEYHEHAMMKIIVYRKLEKDIEWEGLGPKIEYPKKDVQDLEANTPIIDRPTIRNGVQEIAANYSAAEIYTNPSIRQQMVHEMGYPVLIF